AHALAPLCRGRGARLVVTRRMDYVPTGGLYARFLYNRAVDAVIAISEGVRQALLQAGVRGGRSRARPRGGGPAGGGGARGGRGGAAGGRRDRGGGVGKRAGRRGGPRPRRPRAPQGACRPPRGGGPPTGR